MTPSIGNLIVETARAELGTKEWPGAKHNPRVLSYYETAGHAEVRSDEVPWCAAFVGFVLSVCGLPTSGSLLARSYAGYGEEVKTAAAAKPGDIVIWPRGEPWQGHVEIIEEVFPDKLICIGGNVSNQVKRIKRPVSGFVTIRRVKAPRSSVAESKAVRVGTGGAATAATGAAAAIGGLEGNAQIVAIVLCAVVGLAFLYLIRDRVKKWAEGIR